MSRQAPGTSPVPAPTDAPDAAVPLLPPRPNLGPEPWREPGREGLWIVAAVLLVPLLGAIALRLRAKRSRRRSAAVSSPGSARQEAPLPTADASVSRAEAIRSAMIAAFGPSWAARTTEEIAGAPELAGRLGPERAARVVDLLAEADLAKFAGGVAADDQGGDDVDRWVAEVVEALAEDGANSTSSGR